MDELKIILFGVASFLPARGVFACSRVNKEWNSALTSTEDAAKQDVLWLQVCKNTRPQAASLTQEIQDQGFGLKLFAKALEQGVTKSPLKMEDTKALVELYRNEVTNDGVPKRNTLGLWLCPVTKNGIDMEENAAKAILNGNNPYSAEHVSTDESIAWRRSDANRWNSLVCTSPVAFAAKIAVGMKWTRGDNAVTGSALKVKISLLRRDTNQCVCLVDRPITAGGTCYVRDNRKENFTVSHSSYTKSDGVMLQIASNETGQATRATMMDLGGFTKLTLQGKIQFVAILPARGSNEEPEWFFNARRLPGHYINPSAEDLAVLSSIPDFEFELLDFNFRLSLEGKRKAQSDYSTKDLVYTEQLGSWGKTAKEDKEIMNTVLSGLCWE